MLRQLDLANVLTLIGLAFAYLSALFAIQSQFYLAIILMILSGIVDLFDGLVARHIQRSELQSQVGKQLDSIVDVCSFGFAPAIFAYCFGLNDPLSVTLLIFYVAMNALRLAYFNSTGLSTEGDEQYFTGLPVTYAAMFIPLAFTTSLFLDPSTVKLILDGLYLVLAIAMVSEFKIIKPRAIWYVIFSLGAAILIGIYFWAVFPL
jgi:CDP-diacylglycerol---serine O-phosphatidyltransferase